MRAEDLFYKNKLGLNPTNNFKANNLLKLSLIYLFQIINKTLI